MIKQGPGLLPIAFNKGPIRMLYHIHLKRGKGGEEGNLGSDLDVSAFYKFFCSVTK